MDTNKTGKQLKAILESTEPVSASVKTRLILSMAFPAMCAQISVILMHYIDASMVGSLGAGDSAALCNMRDSTSSSVASSFSSPVNMEYA